MKLAIILTATIEVAVKGGIFSSDERFKMYYSTLEYYSTVIGKNYPVIFVENSNADLSMIVERFKDSLDLTIYQFRPDGCEYDEFDSNKGKGYNEYLMIKKACERISTDSHLKDITHFLKITGRYSMLNIRKIISEIYRRGMSKGICYMGDIKDTCVYKLIGRDTLSSHWGDSRFFMAELNFYRQEMIDCYTYMDDYVADAWAEHYFLNFSRMHRYDERCLFRFRTQVQFNGVSGSTGGMHDTFEVRLKNLIRQMLRVCFPHIWF